MVFLVLIVYFFLNVDVVLSNNVFLREVKVVEEEENRYCVNCVLICCIKCYIYVCFLFLLLMGLKFGKVL